MLERLTMTPELLDYLFDVSLREPEPLTRLRHQTEQMPEAEMLVPPEQGQFMYLLAKLVGTRKALEVGVFTGFSTAWTALALPPDGKVVACDTSSQWTDIGRGYWRELGVEDKIDLRIAPATETLQALIDQGEAGTYDYAFIDADKENYVNYYELVLELMRPGGLIAVDNVLRSGEVIDPEIQELGTVKIRELNKLMGRDERVDVSLLPLVDGLYLARKRG